MAVAEAAEPAAAADAAIEHKEWRQWPLGGGLWLCEGQPWPAPDAIQWAASKESSRQQLARSQGSPAAVPCPAAAAAEAAAVAPAPALQAHSRTPLVDKGYGDRAQRA